MINASKLGEFNPPLPLQNERGAFNYMSTPKLYGLLRYLATETGGPYLEIGSYRGMSLLAAGKDTEVTCTGIDSFTGVGWREENETILLEQIKPYDNISLIKADYRDGLATVKKSRKKFSVVFLDGPHEEDLTLEQMELTAKLVKKNGYIVVDDIGYTGVALALDRFLQSKAGGKFKIVFERTTNHRNDPDWWNGVCVIQKG